MITVLIWYPINTPLEDPTTLLFDDIYPLPIPNRAEPFRRWGHAGIEFRNVTSETGRPYEDAYRAFWPAVGADWQRPQTGRVINDRAYDVSEEGSEPSRSIALHTGLNEALIYRYWQSLERMPLQYSNTGFNCCGAVAVSVGDGFSPTQRNVMPAYPPISFAGGYVPIGYSNPYALEDWIDDVNAVLAR